MGNNSLEPGASAPIGGYPYWNELGISAIWSQLSADWAIRFTL